MLKRTISPTGLVLTPKAETREGIMFFRFKYMVFLLMKIPDMVLNMVIIISGFWAGGVILPLSEIGPVIGVLVPIAIHILKYIEERKLKRQQRELDSRVTVIEERKMLLADKLHEAEEKLKHLEAENHQFMLDREKFRNQQRDGLQAVVESIEKLTTRKLKTPKEHANDE
jgi:hypothetical protein